MPVTFGDYFASPVFNPAAMALHEMRMQQQWFQKPVEVEPAPSTGLDQILYDLALPTAPNTIPSTNLYAPMVADMFSTPSFSSSASPTQQLWDSLGLISFSRAPGLSSLFGELTVRGGGGITDSVWKDFRRSTEFGPVTQTLAFEAKGIRSKAVKGLASALKKGGRMALKKAGWLLNVPTPTPVGVGVAIVKLVGQEIAMDLGKKGAHKILDYLKGLPSPDPFPYPDTRPTPAPYPGGPPVAFLVDPNKQFLAFKPNLSQGWRADEVPMIWAQSNSARFPTGMVNFNGWFR